MSIGRRKSGAEEGLLGQRQVPPGGPPGAAHAAATGPASLKPDGEGSSLAPASINTVSKTAMAFMSILSTAAIPLGGIRSAYANRL